MRPLPACGLLADWLHTALCPPQQYLARYTEGAGWDYKIHLLHSQPLARLREIIIFGFFLSSPSAVRLNETAFGLDFAGHFSQKTPTGSDVENCLV
ncbi:hypothetical protein B0T25DRAFT_560040, partial [Lasiosphaeria hispida]